MGLDPKKDTKAADNIKKEQESLSNFLKKNAQDLYLATLDSEQRQLQAIWNKYDEKRKLAHGDQEMLRELERQEAAEVAKLVEKIGEDTEKAAMEMATKQAEAWEQIYEAGLTAREKEFYDLQQHYERLYRLADQYGIDKSLLVEQQAAAEAAIRKRHEEQDNADRKERLKEWNDFAVDAAGDLANTIAQISGNKRQADYNARINELERQREAELSNENLTERQRKAINDKYERLVKEEKRKAFLADRKAAIAQALIYTAVGIAKAIPNWVQVAAAAVAGAAQVAVISSQQPPSYASGGMTDRDPEGYVSQATIFRRSATGRPFRAGEAGREWIAPAWMVEDPRYSSVINTLESIRAEKRGGLSHGAPAAPVASAGGRAHDDRGWERLESSIAILTDEVRKANNKKVVFDYRAFEEFQMDIEYARRNQGW